MQISLLRFWLKSLLNLVSGNYTFKAYAQDVNANVNNTDLITVSTSYTAPSISYDATTDADGSTSAGDNIFVNVSASDVGLGDSNISTFIDFDGSLVGWWRMDDFDGSNDYVIDYMGKNNGTVMNNAVQTDEGYFGKGFSFDGVNDYIDFGAPSVIPNGTSPRTISAWIKPSETNGPVIID